MATQFFDVKAWALTDKFGPEYPQVGDKVAFEGGEFEVLRNEWPYGIVLIGEDPRDLQPA